MREFYVVLDNIRSLENIGSIFRTADALGVSKIFLCGITAQPPVGESRENFLVKKTALGAEQTVLFEYYKRTAILIKKLKKQKIQVAALEQDKKAIDYRKFKPKFPLALVVGNEVKGVSKKVLSLCDNIIELPMCGKKESLNVSVAFGIAGYEIIKYIKK